MITRLGYWIIQNVRQGEKKDQNAKNKSTQFFILQLAFAANGNHNYDKKENASDIHLIIKEISNKENQKYESCKPRSPLPVCTLTIASSFKSSSTSLLHTDNPRYYIEQFEAHLW